MRIDKGNVRETECERRRRVASEIDRFFGGWSHDDRTVDEIMAQIHERRTKST